MIRAKWIAPLLALALTTPACVSDSGTGPSRIKPSVATVRLSIAGRTINVRTSDGEVTGGPIILGFQATSLLTATFLRTNGSPDPLVVAPGFELRVEPSASSLTFSRTGPFAGTLRGNVGGNFTVRLRLRSLEDGIDDYSFTVPVTVQTLNQ